MSIQKGCKFCQRYGLPVLPVRPAVMAQDDILTPLHSSIAVPVSTQGETAYTARLLREGFLNIWSESGARWINYYVTSDGYYYPLPEDGEVPPDIVAGTRTPCITKPDELATASLITLPIKPMGMKNGVFWFGWSEVEWTDTVRKKHEDAAYRSLYMQRFDMDVWISSGKEKQTLPMSELISTVAEYSVKVSSCTQKFWSPSPFKPIRPLEGHNLLQAADSLYKGKGAIVVLPDPVAVTCELSHLLTWRLKTHFADDPHYSRGIALSSALSGLKQAMTEQFRRDLLSEDKTRVNISRTIGNRVIAGVPLPPEDPNQAAADTERRNQETFDVRFEKRAEQRWASYEKYIDRDKEKTFLEELGIAVKAYNDNVITPMTEMYLAWLRSPSLIHYFTHNFDTKNVQSGLCYLQSVTDCLEGMQDQVPVSQWLHNQLVAEAFSSENYILQALVFNNEALSKLIQQKVSKISEINDLPWESLMDAISSTTEDYSKAFSLKMEYYINTISSGFIRLIEGVAWSKPALALVTMVAGSGYGMKTVTLTGKRKYFLEAVLRQIAHMTDTNGRISQDKLRPHLDIALHKMKLDGIPMEETTERRFMVLIDRKEAQHLAAIPETERFKQVGKVLHSADDVTDAVFTRIYRSKMAVLKGTTTENITGMTAGSVPFWGCMASIIFQGIALKNAAGDKELLTWQNGSRFLANMVGALGSTMELAERALNDLKALRVKAIVRVRMGAFFLRKAMIILKHGAKYCSWAAIVAIVWDGLNAVDFIVKGDYGLMAASLISGAGGMMLSGALFGFVLGPIGLAWGLIFIFGSAIYMALEGDNDIHKWLKSSLWRRVEKGIYSLPEIYPTGTMEIAAFNEAIKLEDA